MYRYLTEKNVVLIVHGDKILLDFGSFKMPILDSNKISIESLGIEQKELLEFICESVNQKIKNNGKSND